MIGDLSKALAGGDDAAAVGAAYELGSTVSGLDVLLIHFFSDDTDLRSIAAYGIVRAGDRALPALLARLDDADSNLQARIIDVIGDIGPMAADAVAAITPLAASSYPPVRRAAVEALGMLTPQRTTPNTTVVAAPARALDDDDAIVVRNATFAIARMGPQTSTDQVIDQLNENLYHWHHHVRGWSIEALQRLDNARALQLALRYLMSARWDPAAKSGDREVTSRTLREAD